MAQPVWALVRNPGESVNTTVAYCSTYGKWVRPGPLVAGVYQLRESTDGMQWNAKITPIAFPIVGVAGSDFGTNQGHIVVITSGTNKIYEMDNTGTWTDRTPVLSGTFNQIVFCPGIGFIITGVRLGNYVSWQSLDGVLWSGPFNLVINAVSNAFVGTPGCLLLYDGTGTNVNYTNDGSSWTQIAIGAARPSFAVYVPTLLKWLAVESTGGGSRKLWQADFDATNWVQVFDFATLFPDAIYNITFDAHTGYIVVFQFNHTYISTNGTTWTEIYTPIKGNGATWFWQSASIATKTVLVGTDAVLFEDYVGLVISDNIGNPVDVFPEDPTISPPNPFTAPPDGGSPPGADPTFTTDNPIPPVDGYTLTREDYPSGSNFKFLGAFVNSGTAVTTVFHDFGGLFPTGTKKYTIEAVDFGDGKRSDPIIIIIGGVLDMTMSGGISFGGAPAIQVLVNPSGLYTLVVNQTHDILMDRIGVSVITENIKIPTPFGKTGYLNGES